MRLGICWLAIVQLRAYPSTKTRNCKSKMIYYNTSNKIKDIFSGTLSVWLQDVDCLDGVFSLALGVNILDTQQGINNELGEELALSEQPSK